MQKYYASRAKEYEQIYYREEPTRQAEQNQIAAAIFQTLRERNVLEVAVGTGYWTQFVAQVATKTLATDINQEVLEIARQTKKLPNTELVRADAFMLPFGTHSFTGGLANFWFSILKGIREINFSVISILNYIQVPTCLWLIMYIMKVLVAN